ncbi:60S ribosomal protein L14-1-like [Asparagus officinalis]|uniref:60S ribosomal protein L14-1-like n=1 Tax=Asparagus officinalis TaxID=4686 RepID=UPI00098E5FD7|nr:60S ribosomal protein L14-1-like [Asparagus officinalis]
MARACFLLSLNHMLCGIFVKLAFCVCDVFCRLRWQPDIKIDIPRIPKKKSLIAAMEAADVKNKWENSSWGRKLIVQKRRASLNDFDRFKVMLAKIKRGSAIRQELGKLKKQTAA